MKGKVIVPGDLKRKADAKMKKLINSFMKRYFELGENDDSGHEENEQKLIEGLYDIYDPEENIEKN